MSEYEQRIAYGKRFTLEGMAMRGPCEGLDPVAVTLLMKRGSEQAYHPVKAKLGLSGYSYYSFQLRPNVVSRYRVVISNGIDVRPLLVLRPVKA